MTTGGPGSRNDARPRLTVVSGPSGVGKSSVLSVLRELRPDIYFSISVTTRPPRPGEVEGAHYHFIDAETFQKMVDAGDLLEHAHYAGNDYGTPRGPVLDALAQGRPAVLEIELQGARQVKTAMPEAQLVMLVPPSWEELVDRLTGRGTENPDVVDRRLEVAREELAAAGEFEAVLVNSDVRTTAQQLVTLVVGAGHESAVPSD